MQSGDGGHDARADAFASLAKATAASHGVASDIAVHIPRESYDKIVRGRNRFFLLFGSGLATFVALTSLPTYLVTRHVRSVYVRYCRGKVLDLSPKLHDAHDVALYERSRAVRVEYLVSQRVPVDDARYRVDLTQSEASQAERRRAMTLEFMTQNDYQWVGSSVTFDIVDDAATRRRDFVKYDSVVVRDELLKHDTHTARALFDSAAAYMAPDAHFLVMDYGKPTWRPLERALRAFTRVTRNSSSMCLTHDYGAWVREGALYETVREQRALLGLHYALVLRLRRPVS